MASRNRLRPAFLILPALAASFVLAAQVGAATRPPPPCPPRGHAVIAEDATMRVYRPKVRAGNRIELPVIACVIRSRTRMTLFPAATSRRGPGRERPGNLTRIVIAGDVAAFVTNSLTGVDTSGSGLTIADVARRSILREAPVGHGVDAGLVFSSGLTALDVTPEGAAAWITRTTRPLPGRAPGASVFAAPRTGPIVTLDEGPGIEPESLFLSGDTVNWVDDGTTRSAPLPSPPAP